MTATAPAAAGEPGGAGPAGGLGTRVADRGPAGRSVDEAVARAVAHLSGLQDEAGWWKGDLETNVTMDAEDLLLRHVLGILEPDDTARAARWIRSQQRADGTWATFGGGPGDLSTTVEAWVALRLAGDPATPRTCGPRRSSPGPGRGRGHSRVHPDLALAGRAVVVGRRADDPAGDRAAAAVGAAEHLRLGLLGPADDRAARGGVEHEAGVPGAVRRRGARRRSARRTGRPTGWDLASARWTRRSRRTRGTRSGPLRAHAVRTAERWILDRQEADGSWGGIQPPWVYSLIALRLLGHGLDSGAIRSGLAGLDAFTVGSTASPCREDGAGWLEACQSPVWDTALALIALLDAGVPASDPAVRRGTRLAARGGDQGRGRLVGAPAPARPGRLGVRVRQRPLPGRRRHGRGRARAAPGRRRASRAGPGARRRRPRRGLGGGDGQQRRRLGRVRRGQHPRAGPQRCRSATSAR